MRKTQEILRLFVSLSSPKGGEGWGEEALRDQGEIHWMFGVRCWMFLGFMGEGRGEVVLGDQGTKFQISIRKLILAITLKPRRGDIL